MSQETRKFYSLPQEKQVRQLELLATRAISHWGMDSANTQLLKYRENAVFEVSDRNNGQRYAMRVHRAGYHSDAQLRSELQWMSALDKVGLCAT